MAFHSTCVSSDSGGGGEADPKNAMREMFGPGGVNQQVRAAISTCWMMLPEDRRNPESVAAEVRRIVERALANVKEDATAFGFDAPS
jgi:hypothetical protein